MSWLRIGDTATIHPRVLDLHDPADPLVGPAAWGFLLHIATLCAARGTYDVAPGFITQAGGPAAPQLLKACVRAGLLVHVSGTGRNRRYRLTDDDDDLLHIRTKAEKDWEAQQKADNGNLQLTVPVLLRDGDACRYCRRVCQPNDNRSTAQRGRTFDHLRPGQGARTPDDLVVACRGCNGARGAAYQQGASPAELAERFPLLPPPGRLIFVQSTALKLEEQGYTIPTGSVVLAKAEHASRAQSAGRDPAHPTHQVGVATSGPSTTPSDDQHPGSQPGVATPDGNDGRAHPGSQPGVAPPPPPGRAHPANQPGVAPPAGPAAPHQVPDRPTVDRSVTDRSGTAGPGRVGSGSGSGRVAGPPSRLSPDPPRPDSPTRSTTAPRSRRGRRRSRPGGDPR